jgi:hypothetical protein
MQDITKLELLCAISGAVSSFLNGIIIALAFIIGLYIGAKV